MNALKELEEDTIALQELMAVRLSQNIDTGLISLANIVITSNNLASNTYWGGINKLSVNLGDTITLLGERNINVNNAAGIYFIIGYDETIDANKINSQFLQEGRVLGTCVFQRQETQTSQEVTITQTLYNKLAEYVDDNDNVNINAMSGTFNWEYILHIGDASIANDIVCFRRMLVNNLKATGQDVNESMGLTTLVENYI